MQSKYSAQSLQRAEPIQPSRHAGQPASHGPDSSHTIARLIGPVLVMIGVGMLANGDTVENLVAEYPSLTREDIMACLDYAAALAEEQITPLQVAGL